MACLPRVDIALRRASAADLAVLLPDTADVAGRARGAVAPGAETGDGAAGVLRVACCDFDNAAFPPADIARRRASAASLLLLLFALCAIVIPVSFAYTFNAGLSPGTAH